MSLRQYNQSFNAFQGLAESVVSSNTFWFGDASMVDFSITTSSATASRWTLMGYEATLGAGFTSALPTVDANNWQVVKVFTTQGFASLDTIPSWGVMLRTPSASSTTIRFTIHVGP